MNNNLVNEKRDYCVQDFTAKPVGVPFKGA